MILWIVIVGLLAFGGVQIFAALGIFLQIFLTLIGVLLAIPVRLFNTLAGRNK